jgi:hypothetical protein
MNTIFFSLMYMYKFIIIIFFMYSIYIYIYIFLLVAPRGGCPSLGAFWVYPRASPDHHFHCTVKLLLFTLKYNYVTSSTYSASLNFQMEQIFGK